MGEHKVVSYHAANDGYCADTPRELTQWCRGQGRVAHVGSRAGYLIEVMRRFVNEMILSNHGAADDYINAAIYDFGMNGEDGFGFIFNFVNES